MLHDYKGTHRKLQWMCSRGHIWESTPSDIRVGYGCKKCAGKEKLTIEKMKEIAWGRGGDCLSDAYVNSHTKLRWECKEGHVWKAVSNNIQQGHWCPICARQKHSRNA